MGLIVGALDGLRVAGTAGSASDGVEVGSGSEFGDIVGRNVGGIGQPTPHIRGHSS